MISIKPSIVPEYLKGSALNANLSADGDEEVDVPKDCCKLDTSVRNAADLEELLRTLRFWGVDRIPESVVNFTLFNPRDEWEETTKGFAKDFEHLLRVINCEEDRQVMCGNRG